MRSFLCILLLLPCLLAAEVQKIPCPDGSQCPFGKYCCVYPDGEYGCCDLSKDVLENKNLLPALQPFFNIKNLLPALQPFATVNNSMAVQPKTQNAYCNGTQCQPVCIPNIVNAVCCPNPFHACPRYTRCCSNSISQKPWCCSIGLRCYSVPGYCRGGAASISMTMVPILFTFIMMLSAKQML